MKINLAVVEPPRFTMLPTDRVREGYLGGLFIAPTIDSMQCACDAARAALLAARPFLNVHIQSAVEVIRARPGRRRSGRVRFATMWLRCARSSRRAGGGRVRRFELVLPESVEECVRVLGERGPEAKLVAGGTDLLPQLKTGLLKPACVVDLSGVARLQTLQPVDGGGLKIGAAVTARTLERDPGVQSRYQGLAESAALVGSVQIRNLATVGGNVCNAAPSADMAPPLLALDAEAVIAGPRGTRRVSLASFFVGVRRTVLTSDEILVELIVPAPGPRSGGSYRRHTPRRELDIAVVGVASQITLADGVCQQARIALAAVAPTPLRATAAEQALEGRPVTAEQIERAATLAVEATRPISDQRGLADFRRHLVRVLTRRTLTTALHRAGG